MAKRKTPNYRGSLGRQLNPWRDNVADSLNDNYRKLLIDLGIDPNSPDADTAALRVLAERHSGAKLSIPADGREARRALLSAASMVVPGFQLSFKGSKLKDVYAARRPLTRKSYLERDRIIAFVLAVNERANVLPSGRRIGVKRAIADLIRVGQPFADLRGIEGDLEDIYYRHRSWVVAPKLPPLTLCERPDDVACVGEDPYLDEVLVSCRLRESCRFWRSWKVWANHTAVELEAERRALSGTAHYRSVTSP